MVQRPHDAPITALERGRSLTARGEFAAAIAYLADAVSQDPKQVAAWDLLARTLLQLGKPIEALPAARTAAQLAPRSADQQYVLGRAYRGAGDLANAITHFGEAVALEPTNLQLYVSLGSALRLGQRFVESADVYWRALLVDPLFRDARLQHDRAAP